MNIRGCMKQFIKDNLSYEKQKESIQAFKKEYENIVGKKDDDYLSESDDNELPQPKEMEFLADG
jgi:uncharacterized protein YeeX (DUF496 family)